MQVQSCVNFYLFQLHLRSNVSAETTRFINAKHRRQRLLSKFFSNLVALKRAVGFPGSSTKKAGRLFGAGVLGDGLGSFRHGVLGQFSGEKQADGGLDFAARDGPPLVVLSQTGGFGGDALEDVIHEGVHDGHGLRAHSGVGVDLLEDLVDVDVVALVPLLPSLLVTGTRGLLGLGGLLGSLGAGFRRHDFRSNFSANEKSQIVSVGYLTMPTYLFQMTCTETAYVSTHRFVR